MRLRRIRFLALIFAIALLMCGCKPLVKDEDIPESFTVYASFYPIYALSKMVIGDEIPGMTLRQLIQPQDGCLRSYTLSDWDAYLVSRADAVILGGAGLESFESAFFELGENGPAVISAMSSLVLKNGGDDGEDHFSGINPWLFLSVEGAMDITEAICANMIALDEPYEAKYIQNLNRAYERLSALKNDMAEIIKECDRSLPVALAHEGLRYFADEWELHTVCELERESGSLPDEDEWEKMAALLAETEVYAVIVEKQAPKAFTDLLEENGYVVIRLDTLATGTEALGSEGYFDAQRTNANAVMDGLVMEIGDSE